MDGPYVCGRCDCGIRPDGRKFSFDQAHAYYQRIGEWRKAALEENDPERSFPSIFKKNVLDIR